MSAPALRIKRIYEAPAAEDGFRVLVDRLWPRGVSRDEADLDAWVKDVAPSAELRTWFGHDPARFEEFATRYRAELESGTALDDLRALIAPHPVVTLLYGAHDTKANQAVVLLGVLEATR